MRTKLELDDKFNELVKEAKEIGKAYDIPYKDGEDWRRDAKRHERHNEINTMLDVLNWMNGSRIKL